jgi:hypothetical protein
LHAGNHGLGDLLGGFTISCRLASCTPEHGMDRSSVKIEISKTAERGISCKFGKVGTFEKGSLPETPPWLLGQVTCKSQNS